MHEFSAMQSIVDAILKAARENGAEKVLSVELEVGEMTLLNPDQLRFAFSILSRGTIAEGALLTIREIPCTVNCKACGYRGAIDPASDGDHFLPIILRCPRCGSSELSIESGRECSIKRVRVRVPKGEGGTKGEGQNR